MFEFAILLIFPAMMAFAAASDLFTMTISNRVSLVLVAGFFVMALFTGMAWPVIGMHVAAGFLVLSVGFVCFALGWMGGGDVKFATAIALWLGWHHLLEFAVLFSVFGGVLTILTVLVSRWTEPLPILRIGFLANFQRHRTVPYGIALAAAALAVYPSTVWIKILV